MVRCAYMGEVTRKGGKQEELFALTPLRISEVRSAEKVIKLLSPLKLPKFLKRSNATRQDDMQCVLL